MGHQGPIEENNTIPKNIEENTFCGEVPLQNRNSLLYPAPSMMESHQIIRVSTHNEEISLPAYENDQNMTYDTESSEIVTNDENTQIPPKEKSNDVFATNSQINDNQNDKNNKLKVQNNIDNCNSSVEKNGVELA